VVLNIYKITPRLQDIANAVEAELAALEEGLSLALYAPSLRRIEVETDCMEALELVNVKDAKLTPLRFEYRPVRKIMKKDVRILKVSHDANMVSHGLAKFCQTVA
jgi:hypothetical protein